jgi:hypothetical protein
MFLDKNMPNNQVTKTLRTQQSSDKNASYKYTFNLQQNMHNNQVTKMLHKSTLLPYNFKNHS